MGENNEKKPTTDTGSKRKTLGKSISGKKSKRRKLSLEIEQADEVVEYEDKLLN